MHHDSFIHTDMLTTQRKFCGDPQFWLGGYHWMQSLGQNFNSVNSTVSETQVATGVNAAGDAGDTCPQYFGWWGRQREYPPNIIAYFRI